MRRLGRAGSALCGEQAGMAVVAGMCTGSHALLLVYWMLFLVGASSTPTSLLEICQWDKLKASCGSGEVIVIQMARYGRMRLGRCVQTDFGYLGCALDVKSHLDTKCSGRQECEVDVPDPTLKEIKPCSELEAYLEVEYTCVKVTRGVESECRLQKKLRLTEPEGTISSQMAAYGYGTGQCPYVIEARKGQRINITLVDFGRALRYDKSSLGYSPVVCQAYATVREGHSKGTTVCGGSERERNVFMSRGHRVEVELGRRTSSLTKSGPEYLLKYEMIGCADPAPGRGTVFQRDGDTADVTCSLTAERWTLTCHGSKWKGEPRNCTQGENWDIWQVFYTDWSTPYGILIVSCLGVALGILIGVTLLVMALICIRRKRHKQRQEQLEDSGASPELGCEPRGPDGVIMNSSDCSMPLVNTLKTREGDYGYKWRSRPLVPIPVDQVSAQQGAVPSKADSLPPPPAPPPYSDRILADIGSGTHSAFTTFKPREEHIYESPN